MGDHLDGLVEGNWISVDHYFPGVSRPLNCFARQIRLLTTSSRGRSSQSSPWNAAVASAIEFPDHGVRYTFSSAERKTVCRSVSGSEWIAKLQKKS